MTSHDARELARIRTRLARAAVQVEVLRARPADADVELRAAYLAALAREAGMLAERMERRAARRRAP